MQALKEPEFKVAKTSASLTFAKKKITMGIEAGVSVFQLTNEYGNTVSYPANASQFDNLFGVLWQFVKDSQH